jgi:hypothetical protein
VGCIIASFATTVLWYVIGFGLLAGAGIGLGYSSATPPAVKWFSAKKTGLITGLVGAGFGLASVYISPLANYLTGYNLVGAPLPELQQRIDAKADADARAKRDAIGSAAGSAAETPRLDTGTHDAELSTNAGAQLLALRELYIHRTLFLLGIGFLLIVTVLSQFMVSPPAGYIPPDAGSDDHRECDDNRETRKDRGRLYSRGSARGGQCFRTNCCRDALR